ncbi:MAG TPA: undecaprenyl-diphosphate phosphatase [Streptosporangiaceae bacterium]|nr:undecaprenyl-diphosphate phosphatase [Streptosporangiaceae bacterium]
MSHLTYPEAGLIGLIQGVTELFPISSLGHSVLIPALIGGSWAQDLNVSKAESPYLAYIVGLHVATALAMIIYFWRDWMRIIRAFFASVKHVIAPEPGTERWQPQTTDQKLAWMIILATIPVGIAGVALEHLFRVLFSKPVLTSLFLFANGLILLAGERARRRHATMEAQQIAADEQVVAERQKAAVAAGGYGGGGRHSSGQRALKQHQAGLAVESDRRLTGVGWVGAFALGAAQILALLPGISRDGIVMVSGMFRGLSRQDAARFSFLLSAPVILAAGVLKIPDLTGPLGAGIHGQVLFGSVLSFVGAYLALRFLMRYFSDPKRTLTPFAIYSLIVGLGCLIYFSAR